MDLPEALTHEEKLAALAFEGRNVYGPEVGRDALVQYLDLCARPAAPPSAPRQWPDHPSRLLFHQDEHLHDHWLWRLSRGVVDFERVEIAYDADFIRTLDGREVTSAPLHREHGLDLNDQGPFLLRAYVDAQLYEAFVTCAAATRAPQIAVRFMNTVLWHRGSDLRLATAAGQDPIGRYTVAAVAAERELEGALDEAVTEMGPDFRRYT